MCSELNFHYLQILTCTIITRGPHEGHIVFITRTHQEPSMPEDPTLFFSRYQFPVRLSYAMLASECVGQHFNRVRLSLLRSETFFFYRLDVWNKCFSTLMAVGHHNGSGGEGAFMKTYRICDTNRSVPKYYLKIHTYLFFTIEFSQYILTCNMFM